MNIQRFTAPTAREALAKARMTFGDGTLILSNRPTSVGIEVVATGEDTLATLDRNELARQGKRQPTGTKFSPMQADPNSQVIDDAAMCVSGCCGAATRPWAIKPQLRQRPHSLAPHARHSLPTCQHRPRYRKST